MTHVWYAAYGSNLHARRLTYYREGGTPPGTDHTYPGFRDPTPPAKTTPLMLPGSIYFAWESQVWTGGVGFYAAEPTDGWPRGAAARGYLLTEQQFGDLLTQEMYRTPGEADDISLETVLRDGRAQLGPGRYETLVRAGDLDGVPILTFTSSWDPATVELRKPAARYISMIASGLHESHDWTAEKITAYLAELPGIQGLWQTSDLAALVEESVDAAELA